MTTIERAARRGAAALILAATTACASGSGGGGLGEILGSVLGGGATGGGSNAAQVSGVVRQVDTRSRQIGLQLSNGQTVGLGYDDQTQVVYNNQRYAVTSLDPGDQVTARVQQAGSNAYYTDLVQVDQPVQGTGGTTAGSDESVRAVQGTVRQVDQQNGLFSLQTSNGTLTVSLPYNVSRTDQQRFQSLRPGDSVRLYGVYLNATRVELRQFN
ncbi:hypothetical protein [Roseisolibacter sp. H3M3-2]|uniref:hypothetical protein n=1 Tax=Roseisolibacter sp. H3M3-2 TaxID=3031323 RepID=UPI0023DAECD6|nr:hypothetical protein [Roseisolibacter sp. H3M3-2]MDF1504581.1 hypothetical protein [Roseisolibacter sp. H3M3-2]